MNKIGKKFEVTSFTNDKVKLINSLSHRKYRRESNLFVAEGVRVCKEALKNGWKFIYLLYDKNCSNNILIDKLITETIKSGTDIIEVTPQILEKISHKSNPQNILGIIEQKWLALPLNFKKDKFVALERIRDPGNLGTIFRTMDAVGTKNCILLDDCTDPFSYESVRASMGAIFNINIITSSLDNFIKWKIRNKINLIGTALKNSNDYTKTNWNLPFVLIMGNEQIGLTKKILSYCDQVIKIPMLGSSDSLNLAVSTSVALYESIRKYPK